jgi:tungstate transport system ATP-binding protein
MTTLRLNRVGQGYGGKTILREVSLTFGEGRINLLLGPNGSGKTTLLRICALLDAPAAGEVSQLRRGRRVPHPQRSVVTMVFQRPALFNRSVRANLAYPLSVRGLGKDEAEKRIVEAMAVADLEAFADRPALSLSGGEAQRLALARAMVIQPAVLLLDEPAANLDPASRWRIEEMLLQMQDRFGTTVVLTTHDLLQARKLGEAVFFVNAGNVEGPYTAREFFHAPPSEAVSRFISGVLHQNTG